MSAALYLSLASLLLAVGGIVYNAGRVREIREQARRETNGVGSKLTRVIAVLLPMVPKEELEEKTRYVLTGTDTKQRTLKSEPKEL